MRLPVKEHQLRFHPSLYCEELQKKITQQICEWQWVQVSIDRMDEQSRVKTVNAWKLDYKSVSATIAGGRFTAVNVLVCMTIDDPDGRRHTVNAMLDRVNKLNSVGKFELIYEVT